MRLLIHSTSPYVKSGYGVQCGHLALAARDLGHEVAVSAFAGLMGTELSYHGIPVFPAGHIPGLYGLDQIRHFTARWQPDLIVILTDAWVLTENASVLKGLPVAHWMPVDSATLTQDDRRYLADSGAIPVAMSRYGERLLSEAGYEPLYMPHAVDCDAFTPGEGGKLRRSLGVPDDAMVIGMNAANRDTSRKNFFGQMTAFARFRERHPGSLLYLFTLDSHPNGLDLKRMAAHCGIGDAVVFPDRGPVESGEVTGAMLARSFYNEIDLLSACSLSEGFCVPLIEAQACGVPVVTTDGAAMTELCGPESHLVPSEPAWNEHRGTAWFRPSVAGTDAAYEAAWAARGDQGRGELSRKFALAYDARALAAGQWRQALAELEARLG